MLLRVVVGWRQLCREGLLPPHPAIGGGGAVVVQMKLRGLNISSSSDQRWT